MLYRRNNHLDHAEVAYLQALEIDPGEATTLENLGYLYSITQRQEKANIINQKLLRKRKKNPYYYYTLGEIAYEKELWDDAIKQFRAAIALDGRRHQFYFSLAKVYYNKGDLKQSEANLKLAKRYSKENKQASRYQGKIEVLHKKT